MSDEKCSNDQPDLIRFLIPLLGDKAHQVQVFETHISWILVAENYAYKIKKAVHFDFLDFSTLDARRFYCEEEIRLNRRLAPDFYLDVVLITGTPIHPVIGGTGIPIEYAVKMRAFPQRSLWTDRIDKHCLSENEIDELTRILAHFHQSATIATGDSPWSTHYALKKIAEDNLSAIKTLVINLEERGKLDELMAWQSAQLLKLKRLFGKRKALGFVRECHGDLHSGNILTINARVTIFDCIEFNESFRWIDMMNDLAFILMDLQFHGLHMFAARLLNGYLEMTGDFEGLALLRYYQTQRALVRCKVALTRARQLETSTPDPGSYKILGNKYLAFSLHTIEPTASAVIIMHGYSGSGKSTFSSYLAELAGAIRIRSDIERKRLHRMADALPVDARFEPGLYETSTTTATYKRLRELAQSVAETGIPVIVDATFLEKQQRELFRNLASRLGVPFIIIDIHACEATLRERIGARARIGQDASDAGLEVLAQQLVHYDALSDDESTCVLSIDGETLVTLEAVRIASEPILVLLR